MERGFRAGKGKAVIILWTAIMGLAVGLLLAVASYYFKEKQVVIDLDGITFAYQTYGRNVAEVLAEIGIFIGKSDLVIPGLEAKIAEAMNIEIIRNQVDTVLENVEQQPLVETKYVTDLVKIPFQEVKEPSDQLADGQEKVVVLGKEGLIQKTRKLIYQDGELTKEYLIVEKVMMEPTDQVILVGRKKPSNLITTGHGTYRYKEVKEMLATAYYPGPESTAPYDDGYTAIGLEAGFGIIAVDPTVIPLRSKVYIPGYGVALAGDVGGAIKGNRVDLCYETLEEAINFGRQWVQVYILE